MIGTKPKCSLQREDFGWTRHCKPPCCREGAAEDLIRVQISAYQAVLGDLHSTPAITSFACRTISDRRQLTSSRVFKSTCASEPGRKFSESYENKQSSWLLLFRTIFPSVSNTYGNSGPKAGSFLMWTDTTTQEGGVTP